MGAIERLILWENLDIVRLEFAKPADKPEGSNTILYLKPEEVAAKGTAVDPDTGVELELIDKQPLCEWLANKYKVCDD